MKEPIFEKLSKIIWFSEKKKRNEMEKRAN